MNRYDVLVRVNQEDVANVAPEYQSMPLYKPYDANIGPVVTTITIFAYSGFIRDNGILSFNDDKGIIIAFAAGQWLSFERIDDNTDS